VAAEKAQAAAEAKAAELKAARERAEAAEKAQKVAESKAKLFTGLVPGRCHKTL